MKILYHTPTATLRAYPRQDDEPVLGLDPTYEVFDLIQQAQPAHDPATHYLRATEQIDTMNRRVTRGWEVLEHPSNLLTAARAAMAAKFDSMTDAQQAAFFATRVAVESALDRGKIGVARAMVEQTHVAPELEALKQEILALFP